MEGDINVVSFFLMVERQRLRGFLSSTDRNEQVDSYNWHSHNRDEIEAPPTKHPNSAGMEMRQMMAEVVNIVRFV